jgi:ribosome-binding protein aMBF1 (putative translation factor)
MHDFPKLAAQVRGPRALLGWSQSYLAEAISVRRAIIADFESCKREPRPATLSALIMELRPQGSSLRKQVSSFWNGHRDLTYRLVAQG